MKILVLLVVTFVGFCEGGTVILPATTTLVRMPQHDSAIIQSDRVGGNFAYSTIEGHAYAAIKPIIRHAQTPVAVSYETEPVVAPMYAPQYTAYMNAAAHLINPPTVHNLI